MTKPIPTPAQEQLVRTTGRALARAGLATAYGHCSLRLDAEHFLVCAPRPMGLLTPQNSGTVVSVHGPLPDGVLGEVRIHQQVYKRRTEVNGICRFFPPHVMALAAMKLTPSARHGFSSYFYPHVPRWEHTALVRNEAAAEGVVDTLGNAPAVVVSVNGAVTVADSIQKALVLAWFLEDAGRVENAVQAAGHTDISIFNTPQEAQERATWNGGIVERMWDYLTHDDIEATNT
ncbi:class II aldolase/adducin family protein [Limnohabitans sp. JirII-31]|uniref:class II aldolase/adducin family protein n=1 Tax=Limnohabitans sp. JirII-31 TaxID=1977908 RepID=UPI000C1F231B|nr:class II aldolase/adducin family protein [Limnohabitans sp. JirII-31]PIT80716.1 class II aldolase [Limnohabitans sp. JirII-31]